MVQLPVPCRTKRPPDMLPALVLFHLPLFLLRQGLADCLIPPGPAGDHIPGLSTPENANGGQLPTQRPSALQRQASA